MPALKPFRDPINDVHMRTDEEARKVGMTVGLAESEPHHARRFRSVVERAELVSNCLDELAHERARDVALLTLSHPHYDRARQTLTYRATPLRGRDPALASFGRRADPVTAGRLGAASLFIDDGGGASTEVTFSIQSAVATSSSVRFLVDGGAWSLSSVGTLAIVGTPSVSSIYATRGALSIGLPAAEPLNMEVSVPLEQEGAEAPSVEVTNVVGTITVTWTTTTGLQTQTLLAGDPLVLYGLAP